MGEVWEFSERQMTELQVSAVWRESLYGRRRSGKQWFLYWGIKPRKLQQTRTLLLPPLHSFYRFYGVDTDILDTEQDAAFSPPI